MKVAANTLRKGHVVEYNNKLWMVVECELRSPGKGAAVAQVIMKDIVQGTKMDIRWATQDMVERVRIEEEELQFLYATGDEYTFMNIQNYEQVTLSGELIGDQKVYLQDGMVCKVQVNSGKVLSMELPETVTMEIVEADPVVKGQTASSSYKPAKLANGARVLVPPHIESGTRIVVRTADSSYVRTRKGLINMAARRSAYLNVMVDAAEKAGRALIRDFGEVEQLQVSKKGPGDFVSAADRKAEKILKEELLKARPTYGFLLEEEGEIKGEDASYRWIIDPLDGTTNFLHGLPHWSISIALEKDKEIVAAVIHDPIKNELFHAEKGAGAFSNAKRLRVSGRPSLMDGLVGVGDKFFNESCTFPSGLGVRRMGSACLALAYVAAGRLDAYWEEDLKPWDKAAGSLLVKEAGGYVSEIDGGKNFVYGSGILAANPALHTDLLQRFKQFPARGSVKAKTAP